MKTLVIVYLESVHSEHHAHVRHISVAAAISLFEVLESADLVHMKDLSVEKTKSSP